MPTGLRERKKRQTRAAIADAALELFLRRGFEQTTVAEIADAAEVSPRTFFSYFPTKEAVLFSELGDDLAAMERHLAGREPEATALDAIQTWILEAMADPEFSDTAEIRRRKLIRSTPALSAYESAHVDPRFRDTLAAAVATDLDLAPTDLPPQMVAAAASAALKAMVDYYADSGGAQDPEHLLAQATDFLEAGLASLNRD